MIKSMTGYGFGRSQSPEGTLTCEIKTINHRYFELSSRLPNNFVVFEERIKKLIQQKVKRGRVNLLITYHHGPVQKSRVVVNTERANKVYRQLCRLAKQLNLQDKPTLDQVLANGDIVVAHAEPAKMDKMWALTRKSLVLALAKTDKTRAAEGRRLLSDIVMRVKSIKLELKKVTARAPKVVDKFRRKLEQNLKANGNGNGKNKTTEIINFTKSIDITEELIRLESHLEALDKVIAKKSELGRHLDFVAQEMHREVNTIAAKANDYQISSNSILMRGEIDKIREQAQNIE